MFRRLALATHNSRPQGCLFKRYNCLQLPTARGPSGGKDLSKEPGRVVVPVTVDVNARGHPLSSPRFCLNFTRSRDSNPDICHNLAFNSTPAHSSKFEFGFDLDTNFDPNLSLTSDPVRPLLGRTADRLVWGVLSIATAHPARRPPPARTAEHARRRVNTVRA
ncbi:hypothetical protein EVAR_76931_1 [Eumeta japonica]|uniref:Uncharacterized protein n=1 Tax=Eumeta variegata TaxID=151549 RepID=A0A4C1SF14_EUMVA|nr:hypothetical protein EVAR_76931_1 [Eumeta japonica]